MPNEKKLCMSTSGLTKVFGFGRTKTLAVDHVDLNLYEGEVVSLVGESGSGKTTLAKMLLGLINQTEGDVYFQGQKRDISTHRKRQDYWKNIQAIFQFDQRRIIDIQTWDGSVHLLAKVPLLSTSIGTLGKKLDHGLVRYLTRLNWQRFQGSSSILDVQQVTLDELRHSIGYAAMFCAVYTAPVRVWPQDKRDK